MNPYAISAIARIKQNERLAEAERTRRSNPVRRARSRGIEQGPVSHEGEE
jgi:hypothetical protein